MASYGLPYMGSKSKIAHKIAPLFPKAKTFVDLFAGGGAMTHYLMTNRKYHHFIYNDINPLMPKAFEMALNGEFEKETRWISREDFFRLRDTDPYAAICFSFGNNLSGYMYNKDIEPIKQAYHYAIFFGDYSLAKERMGIDLSPLSECATITKKYALLKRIVKSIPPPPPFSRNEIAVMGEKREGRGRAVHLERLQRLWKIYNPQRRFNVPNYPPPILSRKLRKKSTLG